MTFPTFPARHSLHLISQLTTYAAHRQEDRQIIPSHKDPLLNDLLNEGILLNTINFFTHLLSLSLSIMQMQMQVGVTSTSLA